MTTEEYGVQHYVSDLRRIAAEETDPHSITERLKPFSVKLASASGWFREEFRSVDPDQGFGVHVLHEEENHDLAVTVFAWAPGRGIPPHNHRTWAVVAGIEGLEEETSFMRHDDGSRAGYAEIEPVAVAELGAGDVSVCMPDDIHSVRNAGDVVSVSLHTYGRHLNFTGRSVFDAQAKTEAPLIVKIED